MYYLQHERPCCIGYTNSSRRREFVYPIQHGRECCKWLVKFRKYVSKRILRYVYLRCWNNDRCLLERKIIWRYLV